MYDFRKGFSMAGDMAQMSSPITYIGQLTIICNSNPKGSYVLFWPLLVPSMLAVHIHKCKQTLIYIKQKYKSSKKTTI